MGAQLWQLPGAAGYRAKFGKWLAECGAVTRDVDLFSGQPTRVLALVPEAMQPHADRVDRQAVTFVGPCFGERDDQGAWVRPEGAGKVLLISLGTTYTRQPEFYRQCLKAFGELPGWHVVLQVGKQTEVGGLGEIPGNVEVHRWAPQLAILWQAAAFVTHAGRAGAAKGCTREFR